MTALSPSKNRPGPAWLGTRHHAIVAQAFRYLGALAVLATGVAHIEQYAVDNYSTVPTIGTLFLLNFIAAIVIAVGLIAPLGASPETAYGRHPRRFRRRGDRARSSLARRPIHLGEHGPVRVR